MILRRFWLLGFVEASFLRAEKTLGESAEGGKGKALNCLQCQLNKLNVLIVKELPGNRAAAEPLLLPGA